MCTQNRYTSSKQYIAKEEFYVLYTLGACFCFPFKLTLPLTIVESIAGAAF